jgi:hypothetical protein
MHAGSRSELRTPQVMACFRVAYIASTSLPCFSVRCSHVSFLVSFLLSCYLRVGIYNNFRTFTYLNRTLCIHGILGCDLLRSVICFPSLQSRASVYMIYIKGLLPCFDCVCSFYACLLAVGFIHQHTFIEQPFFPPGLLQSQATKDAGSNRWPKCYADPAIICEPTAPAIAYGLGIVYVN